MIFRRQNQKSETAYLTGNIGKIGQRIAWSAVMIFLVLYFSIAAVQAEEGIAGGIGDLTIQIKETASVSPAQVLLHVILPDYTDCDYEIYRSTKDPQKGGQMNYMDTICGSGQTWYRDGSYYVTTGQEHKVQCYRTSGSSGLTGGVVFVDTYARLGETYWYQIVLRDWYSDQAVYSNLISGHSVLAVPYVKKCCLVSEKTVQLTWERTSKTQGYEIYRKTGSGKWKRIAVLKNNKKVSYKDSGLKSGKTYRYKMRSYYKTKGKKIYSEFSDVYKVTTKKLTVKGTYKPGSVYGPSLNGSKLIQVRRVVQSFKDNYIKKGMTDYEKLWTAFCYLRDNCDYAPTWQKNDANTAWGALVYGEAQCSGYARAMKALCDAIGIDCRYVHADAKAVNPSHQWVQVKIDKKWYIVDAQGGFFLVGSDLWKNYVGMSWKTSGLPKVNRANHQNGGFVSSEV